MPINYLHLFGLAFLGSIIALIGGVIFLYSKRWSAVLEKNSVPFAAGVLITVALFGLLPEALELLGPNTFLIILIAFFTAYCVEHFFLDIHHHEGHQHKNELKFSAVLVIIGDMIHNFIDGVSIGASFLINPGLGFITAFSTFLHEVPHEIGDFGILLKAGWKRKNVLLVNIFSASMAIVGAFSLLLFAESEVFIGSLLAISAGIFLYLGTIDFLPRATHGFSNKLRALIPMAIGIIIMLLTLFAIPHGY